MVGDLELATGLTDQVAGAHSLVAPRTRDAFRLIVIQWWQGLAAPVVSKGDQVPIFCTQV